MHRQKIKEQEEHHSTSSKHLDTSTESDDILSNVESPSSVTSSGVSPQEKRFRDSSPQSQSPPQNQLKPAQKRRSPLFDDVTSSIAKSQNNESKKRRFESRPAMTSSLDVLSQIFPARSRSSLEEVLRETNGDLNRALEICARSSSRENHRKLQHASKTFSRRIFFTPIFIEIKRY